MTEHKADYDAVLPDEPEHDDDPRWIYAELSRESSFRGWPCGECGVRRDEHADQSVQSTYPGLDITEHLFVDTMPSTSPGEAGG